MDRKNFLSKIGLILISPYLFIKSLGAEKDKREFNNKEFNLLTSINLFFGSKQEAKDKMKDLKFIPFNITGTEEQIFNRLHLALATTFSYGYSKRNGTKQEDELKRLLKRYNISREDGVTYEV